MLFITRNSSIKNLFLSPVARRALARTLSAEAQPSEKESQEADEKKSKQQKYQELEKLRHRPLYLDALATTPMVMIDD